MQHNYCSFFTTTLFTQVSTRLWTICLILALSLFLSWPTHLHAQSTTPTPMPLAPANTLIAVAGGHGAALWDASGVMNGQVEAGTRLVASKRSVDGQWLYVTTNSGVSGWAAATSLIVFYRIELLTEAVTITPTTPTPTAAPSVATSEAPTTTVTTTTTATTTATTSADDNADTATQATVLSSTRLNIRSGPGTTYDVIGKAEPGQHWTSGERGDSCQVG